MTESIHTIVYASSARWHLSEIELENILKRARINNTASGISGLLLYSGGNFLQVLEGAKDVVEKLYDRIERDNRHTGVMRLMEITSQERNFDGWSMGYRKINEHELETAVPGFNKFLSCESACDELKGRINSSVWALLKSFRKIVNV